MSEDIIRMAREAGFSEQDGIVMGGVSDLERFTALVRADERERAMRENAYVQAEREACAKVCDNWPNGRDDVYEIGVAIRARGNT